MSVSIRRINCSIECTLFLNRKSFFTSSVVGAYTLMIEIKFLCWIVGNLWNFSMICSFCGSVWYCFWFCVAICTAFNAFSVALFAMFVAWFVVSVSFALHAIFIALFAISVALIARSVAVKTLSFWVVCIVNFGMDGFLGASHEYPPPHEDFSFNLY